MMGHGDRFRELPEVATNKCSKSERELFEQIIDLSASVIKPHSFSNY